MLRVAIFGAGGLGRVVRDIFLQDRRARAVAFLDSDHAKHGQTIDGLSVVGGLDRFAYLRERGVTDVVVAIGDNAARMRIARDLADRGARLGSAIHPLASISPTAQLGEHLIVGARVMVCVHASIGSHCVLSTGSIVEHDNRLADGVFLHPAVRLAGAVTVGEGATLGIGACVIPGRKVGRWAQVEPGSVVIRDVPPANSVSGIPAQHVARAVTRFIHSSLANP